MAAKAIKTSHPVQAFLLGMIGVALVGVVHLFGLDRRAELGTLDMRLRAASHADMACPMLLVAIDDSSIEELGRWPWPRRKLADLIDELNRCGARGILLDVLFSDPQEVRYVAAGDAAAGSAGGMAQAIPVLDDALLADAMRRVPALVLAAHLTEPDPRMEDVPHAAVDLFRENLQATPEDLAKRLGQSRDQSDPHFRPARLKAIDELVAEILHKQPRTSLAEVLVYLAETARLGRPAGLQQVAEIRSAYLRWRGRYVLRRFGLKAPGRAPADALRGELAPPMPAFGQAVAAVGLVKYRPDKEDGLVRYIDLVGRCDQGAFPQLAMSAAIEELRRRQHGAPCEVRSEVGAVTVACGTVRRVIPVDDRGRMMIRWMQRSWPPQSHGLPRVRAAALVTVAELARRIDDLPAIGHIWRARLFACGRAVPNTPAVEKAYWKYQGLVEPASKAFARRLAAEAEAFRAALYRPGQGTQEDALADLRKEEKEREVKLHEAGRTLLAELRKPGVLPVFLGRPEGAPPPPTSRPASTTPAPPDAARAAAWADYRQRLATCRMLLARLDRLPQAQAQFRAELAERRAGLREMVRGRLCLVGSTAQAAADFVSTPIHEDTPGVVVHANVVNTILSGRFLHEAPAWLNWVAVLAAGAAVAFLAATRSVVVSMVASVVLAGGYVALNTWVVFGMWDTVLVLISPLWAMAGAFAATTAYRQLTEERAKRQIRGLLAQTLSPELLDEVQNDPSLFELGGQRRVLTCLFSDIAGFTPLAEQLGSEQTVRLLNRYFDGVGEVIRVRHGGYLNKFLGDGVLAFFNAPVLWADHPKRAILAALACQEQVRQLNLVLGSELGRPVALSVRIGVATGEATVGNCGSTDRVDYTAIGECVNLAARLEAANKTFSTGLLVADSTWQAAGADDLLARPLGGVRVEGFAEPQRIWHVAGPVASAEEEVRQAYQTFAHAIEQFAAGDYAAAGEGFAKVLADLGGDRPAAIYADLCRRGLAGEPAKNLYPEYKKAGNTDPDVGSSNGKRDSRD